MKLKTLKDISEDYDEGMNDKGLKEIKQEAINWAKELRKGEWHDDYSRKENIKLFRYGHILWIKHFFDIAEAEI